jgi:hypothetical protein
MQKVTSLVAIMSAFLAASCSPSGEPTEPAAETTKTAKAEISDPANVKQISVETAPVVEDPENRFAGWAGKWIGPEGMYVDIKPSGNGQFELEMQSDLDTKGTYTGNAEEHGIRFTRNGDGLLLYRTNGDETGLKYLAGKKECLMVKSGEGYCRD